MSGALEMLSAAGTSARQRIPPYSQSPRGECRDYIEAGHQAIVDGLRREGSSLGLALTLHRPDALFSYLSAAKGIGRSKSVPDERTRHTPPNHPPRSSVQR